MSHPPQSPQPAPQGPQPGQPGWGAPPAYPVAPAPKKKRTGLVIGLVVGAVVLLCICGGIVATVAGGGSPGSSGTTAAGDPADATEPTPVAGKIGQPARDGKFEFTVKTVKCGVDEIGGEYGEKAQGQFCLITLTIKNIGDEAQMFNDFDQKAYDADGKEYKPNSQAGWFANEDTDVWLNDINPGNQVTGVLVFDVPKNAKLTTLELHDSSFSGGVEISLGS